MLVLAKPGKAPGLDQIPVEFYQNAPSQLLDKLAQVFDDIYNKGKVPDSFRRSLIFPIHKKGDTNSVLNYHEISFIDAICKLFTGKLLNLLISGVKNRRVSERIQYSRQ